MTVFEEDLDAYFNADELGDLCVVGGSDVVGVFTRSGGIVEGVETASPILVAATDDLPSTDHGTTVEAPKGSGASFKVRQALPDGTGRVTTLVLEEV